METTTIPSARVIPALPRPAAAQPPSSDDPGRGIEQIVARHFGIEPWQVHIRSRRREICNARQVCMWWRIRYTLGKNETLAKIGSRYGEGTRLYDHSTVLHARKAINNLVETDKSFRLMAEAIEREAREVILCHTAEQDVAEAIAEATKLLTKALERAGFIADPDGSLCEQDRISNALILLKQL